jgi:hypothetical protein
MLELIAIPTITTASVMTALAVAQFAGAVFTVGSGLVAVAPSVMAAAPEVVAAILAVF